jgi:hypothetical protein
VREKLLGFGFEFVLPVFGFKISGGAEAEGFLPGLGTEEFDPESDFQILFQHFDLHYLERNPQIVERIIQSIYFSTDF